MVDKYIRLLKYTTFKIEIMIQNILVTDLINISLYQSKFSDNQNGPFHDRLAIKKIN